VKKIWKVTAVVAASLALAVGAVACSSDADVASKNLSKEAEDFKINRRVVFYNAILGTYILVVEGRCSVEPGETFTVTCKIGDDKAAKYKKHFLGKSDNVLWFAEQLEAAGVSTSHYKVFFNPSTLVPDVAVK
jgi:hypothetical protein